MDRGEATWVSAEDMPEAGWEYLRAGQHTPLITLSYLCGR